MERLLIALLLSSLTAAGTVFGCQKEASGKDPEEKITEITLIRTSGLGVGPQDRLVLHADGAAVYAGARGVQRMGEYEGALPKGEFQRLCRLLQEKGFFELDLTYRQTRNGRIPVTDVPGVTVTALRGQTRKSVSEYGRAAPAAFKEVVKELLAASDRVNWQKKEQKP